MLEASATGTLALHCVTNGCVLFYKVKFKEQHHATEIYQEFSACVLNINKVRDVNGHSQGYSDHTRDSLTGKQNS
jgi:hypothetical protein